MNAKKIKQLRKLAKEEMAKYKMPITNKYLRSVKKNYLAKNRTERGVI